MSQRARVPYGFDDDLRVNEVSPGTVLFVAGSSLSRAKDLALSLALAGADAEDGMLFITTTDSGENLLERCERLSPGFDDSPVGVVDCSDSGGREPGFDARIESVSSPNDLTGIGINFSTLYSGLHAETDGRVRTAFVDVSTLLMYTDLRTLFRFLHTISGRIDATNGIGVFAIDPGTHDEQSVSTLTQLCDGRIDVREPETGDGDGDLRIRGLSNQPREWTPFHLGE